MCKESGLLAGCRALDFVDQRHSDDSGDYRAARPANTIFQQSHARQKVPRNTIGLLKPCHQAQSLQRTQLVNEPHKRYIESFRVRNLLLHGYVVAIDS